MNLIDRLKDNELYVDAVDEVIAVLEDVLAVGQSAVHALRSYQYGNASPDLAEEVANRLEKVLRMVTHD